MMIPLKKYGKNGTLYCKILIEKDYLSLKCSVFF